MQYIGGLRVIPRLPKKIQRLRELAFNLYFSWHPEVRDLFITIDKNLWKLSNHNPVKFLNEVQQKKLETVAAEQKFLKQYHRVLLEFDQYLSHPDTWFTRNHSNLKNMLIAYFTAEFGFHESLPIYAGGLGVLAGDHLKSASDLGIPIVGISLFYDQTYFTQEIDTHGNQITRYDQLNPYEHPLELVKNKNGETLLVPIQVGNHKVHIRVWKANIGRITAYLLDSNVPQNHGSDREITSRLYGGDQEMRIAQEIILGMGGVLVLEALGIKPTVWHLNEGHSVFLSLQRIQEMVTRQKLAFYEALEATASNTIFTTHTPVPAGNDAFPLHIKDKYFQKYWEAVGIRRHQFMELGSQIQPEGYEIFNLTILALNLSRFRNAVSKLHGEVSQKLWQTVWPDFPFFEVPIDHITNGVHTATWMSRPIRRLLDQYLPANWMEIQDNREICESINAIPGSELWQVKIDLKKKLFNHLRERLEVQYEREKIGSLQVLRIKQALKPEVLTIGFARRFATYKRGTLIFRNMERLKAILNDPDRPVQLIFAGKAHPRDNGGQDLIRQIHHHSLDPEIRGRIIFIENYDMGLARDLISGVDIWLNNPRRTQEASGTSGQKVGMNAGMNFSVLDGWWNEGFNGENGWAFGDQENYDTLDDWDSWDSEELYDILENDIIPRYYNRNQDQPPEQWIRMMRNSMESIIPVFNTHRMLKAYFDKLYIPAHQKGRHFAKNQHQIAREVSAWRDRIDKYWSDVSIEPLNGPMGENGSGILNFGETSQIEAKVWLGSLKPEEVQVQIYLKRSSVNPADLVDFEVFPMHPVKDQKRQPYRYQATIQPSDSGQYFYTLRILPYHPELSNLVEIGLAEWYLKS